MIMLLKIHSSLLVLTILALFAMVTSKPTFRTHRRGDARLAAAKTLKPLKQYNMRQHPTKRTEIFTVPKPSKFPVIPIPATADVSFPTVAGVSDVFKEAPILGAISSATGTKLNPDVPAANAASTVGDVTNILSTLSGNSNILNGFSGPTTNVKAPIVSSNSDSTSPAAGSLGVNSSGGKVNLPASSVFDTPFGYTVNGHSRREKPAPRNRREESDELIS